MSQPDEDESNGEGDSESGKSKTSEDSGADNIEDMIDGRWKCSKRGCLGKFTIHIGHKMWCSPKCANEFFHLNSDGTPDMHHKAWKSLKADEHDAFIAYIRRYNDFDIGAFRRRWINCRGGNAEIARYIHVQEYYEILKAVPSFIFNHIDWNAVWGEIASKFDVVNGFYFNIL